MVADEEGFLCWMLFCFVSQMAPWIIPGCSRMLRVPPTPSSPIFSRGYEAQVIASREQRDWVFDLVSCICQVEQLETKL